MTRLLPHDCVVKKVSSCEFLLPCPKKNPELRTRNSERVSINTVFRSSRLILFFLSLIILLLTPFDAWGAALPGKREEPIHLKANVLQYFKAQDIYLAEGAASVEQGPMRLKADMIRLKEKTGELSAIGHVHYFDGENTIEAERIVVDIDTKLGVLYNGKLFLKEDGYYIEGEKIIRHTLDHYELKTSSFTACDCQEDPAWRIRAANLDMTVEGYLFAKHTRFYVKDVPIFYLPYFIYPAKRKRQTGLLAPRLGYSSKYGFRYKQSLFLALADNQDATIYAEHRGGKGNGLGLEYRYILSKKGRGSLNAEYFQDREDKVDRWAVRFNHEQQFTNRLQGKIDLKYVNETSNFRELSDTTAVRAQQNIESNLSLTYRGNSSYAYLLARYTQDLTKSSNSNTPQRLPEIGYSLIEYHPGNAPFYLNFDTTAVNFWSEGGLNLQRVDLYPKLSLPLHLGKNATLTPWAGFRETWYRHGDQKESAISREIIPTGITLTGNTSKRWGETTQKITPSLMYENIVVENGNDIIQIDEIDSLHERQTVTTTVMQRFLKSDHLGNPVEKGSLRLTESYHLDQIAAESLSSRRFSDLRTELHLRPWSRFSVEVDTFYNLYNHQITSWNTDLGLVISPYINLTLTQRSTRDGTVPKKGDLFNPYYLGDREGVSPEINFYSGTVSISSPWGFRFTNKAYYDVDKSKLIEVDYLLEYQAQCWGIGFSFLNFHDRNEFSFTITLKGLGGFSPEQNLLK